MLMLLGTPEIRHAGQVATFPTRKALAEATDFLPQDVGYDGITGVMKLAHAAERLGLDIEFHGPGPAQRQCMAAVRNTSRASPARQI